MTDIFQFKKVGRGLEPIDFVSQEKFDSLKNGERYKVSIVKPRSQKNHAHFFGLIQWVADFHRDKFKSYDFLLLTLKQADGLLSYQLNPLTNNYVIVDGSISFEKMDEEAFKGFKERSIHRLCEYFECDIIELFEHETSLRRAA